MWCAATATEANVTVLAAALNAHAGACSVRPVNAISVVVWAAINTPSACAAGAHGAALVQIK